MVYGYYPFNPADPKLPKKMMEGQIRRAFFIVCTASPRFPLLASERDWAVAMLPAGRVMEGQTVRVRHPPPFPPSLLPEKVRCAVARTLHHSGALGAPRPSAPRAPTLP